MLPIYYHPPLCRPAYRRRVFRIATVKSEYYNLVVSVKHKNNLVGNFFRLAADLFVSDLEEVQQPEQCSARRVSYTVLVISYMIAAFADQQPQFGLLQVPFLSQFL